MTEKYGYVGIFNIDKVLCENCWDSNCKNETVKAGKFEGITRCAYCHQPVVIDKKIAITHELACSLWNFGWRASDIIENKNNNVVVAVYCEDEGWYTIEYLEHTQDSFKIQKYDYNGKYISNHDKIITGYKEVFDYVINLPDAVITGTKRYPEDIQKFYESLKDERFNNFT